MSDNKRFDVCVDFVLKHETEYDSHGNPITEHDPHDPGGATKFGIDQRSHPNVDVENLTLEQAKKIYFDHEWTRCDCEFMPVGFDMAVFDAAVNIGMSWAIKALQRILGVTVDGFVGPNTVAATQTAHQDKVSEYLDAREEHYRQMPTKLRLRYLKGWLNRVSDLRTQIASDLEELHIT